MAKIIYTQYICCFAFFLIKFIYIYIYYSYVRTEILIHVKMRITNKKTKHWEGFTDMNPKNNAQYQV